MGQAYFDNDLLAQFGPWRAFLKDRLASGHLPLWNPYGLGGQPFFADLQNMMVYPLNWLTLPFSVPFGLSLFFFLHAFLSAIGMHLWMRSLGLSRPASCVGALLFAFSNFFWLEIIHPPVIAAYSWLPWLFWSLEKLVQSLRPRQAFLAGLIFTMLFLCGSFQVTVGAFYGGLAYFLFRNRNKLALSSRLRIGPEKIGSYLLLIFAFVWGLLPILVQLIPTLEFSALCDRRAPGQTYEQLNASWGLHPLTLYQFLFPRFTLPIGQSMAEAIQYRNGPENLTTNFLSNYGYLGIWIPFLLYWAFRGKKNGTLIFLLVLSLGSLCLCMGKSLPLHRWCYEFLPGFSLIRVPYRFLFLYVLGISSLAAFGLDKWCSFNDHSGTFTRRLIPPLVYALVLYIAALVHPSQNWRELVALGLGIFALFLFSSDIPKRKWGIPLFQLALILPLFLNGLADFVPGPAVNFEFVKNSKTLGEIEKQVQPYRVIFDNSHMGYPLRVGGKDYILNYPQNASCVLGIKNFGGYNPLILNAKNDLKPFPIPSLVRLGAIHGIITGEDHGPIPDFKLTSYPPYFLYEYQKPLLYAFAPENIAVIQNKNERLKELASADFDPYHLAVLSDPLPETLMGTLPKGPSHLQYRIDQDDPELQKFTLQVDRTSLVVFAEVLFPGWKAQMDGKSADLITADHLLRSLVLPAGTHQVEFRFRPSWFAPLFLGLALWLVTTLGWLFRSYRRSS
jgi:hypothetical protein